MEARRDSAGVRTLGARAGSSHSGRGWCSSRSERARAWVAGEILQPFSNTPNTRVHLSQCVDDRTGKEPDIEWQSIERSSPAQVVVLGYSGAAELASGEHFAHPWRAEAEPDIAVALTRLAELDILPTRAIYGETPVLARLDEVGEVYPLGIPLMTNR